MGLMVEGRMLFNYYVLRMSMSRASQEPDTMVPSAHFGVRMYFRLSIKAKGFSGGGTLSAWRVKATLHCRILSQ